MFRKQVVLTKKSPTKTNQKDSCRNVVSPSGEEIPERTALLNEALAIAAEMVLEEVERATKKLREEKESYAKRAEYFDAKVADLEAVIKAKDLDITQLQKREVETVASFEKQLGGLHELLAERDEQIQRLGEMLQREIDEADIESGAIPRIGDMQERVRCMQDAVDCIVNSHFEHESSTSFPRTPVSTTFPRSTTPFSSTKKFAPSPAACAVYSELERSFQRASDIKCRHKRRIDTPRR